MTKKNIAVVYGTFHKEESQQMLEEVHTVATAQGLEIVVETPVPGSLEVPLALKHALLRDDIDGAVVLGIIERGETKHGFTMGQSVMDAVIALQLETMKPVGYGILGPEILPDQIAPRLRKYAAGAVQAVHTMLSS